MRKKYDQEGISETVDTMMVRKKNHINKEVGNKIE